MNDREEIISAIDRRLNRVGLSWLWLLEQCEQIILFGSRAANVHFTESDFDLLCVSHPKPAEVRLKSRITPEIDLLWISPERLKQPEWLGSELAQHISRYGRWLHGANTWGSAVFASEQAVQKKVQQIRDRIDALIPRWNRLLPSYQRKYSRLVRRDLQRLYCLTQGEAVPPTPILDREWAQEDRPLIDWVKKHIGPDVLVPTLIEKLPWQEQIPPSKQPPASTRRLLSVVN